MLPPLPNTEDPGVGVSSSPPSSSSSYLSLTDALRISISGESMDYESAGVEGASSGEQWSKSRDLIVPTGMLVDLRVKLALAMIHLGQILPEV
jgi:hypothetical protein